MVADTGTLETIRIDDGTSPLLRPGVPPAVDQTNVTVFVAGRVEVRARGMAPPPLRIVPFPERTLWVRLAVVADPL